MATKITKQPSPGPKNLRIERATENDGYSVKAIWGNPADGLSDTNHRWEGVDGAWYFNATSGMVTKWVEQRGKEGRVTGDWVWVRDQGIHESHTVWINKWAYYPAPNKTRKLTSITADIYPYNSKAGWGGKNHAKATFRVDPPLKPEVEQEVDEDKHEVTWTIKQVKQEGHRFAFDTMWCVMRQDAPGLDANYTSEKVYKSWSSFSGTEDEPTHTYTDDFWVNMIRPGQWVKLTLRAYTRGCAGDSGVTTSTYVHAYPAQAQIKSIVASDLSGSGVVTVNLVTNHNANTAPVDRVVLQRLSDVTYGTAATAGLADGWEDVAEDDAQCRGLSDNVADAIPAAKHHTWYRLMTEHGGFSRYSAPVEATCLYRKRDAVADDDVAFVSVSSGEEGGSVTCQLAWKPDDSNAVEISWSENEDAWESTEQPSTFLVEWEDDEPVEGYQGSCTVTVRGLEDGKSYYLRARRVQTENDTHGAWKVPDKQWYPVPVGVTPTDVLITVPSGVPRGQGMDVTWSYTGGTQAAWMVSRVDQSEESNKTPTAYPGFPHDLYRYVLTTDTAVAQGKTYYVVSSDAYEPVEEPADSGLTTYYETLPRRRYTLAEGDGTAGGCTVPPQALEGIEQMVVVASVTCNGEWVDSDTATVYVAEPPTIAVAVATLTAQPLTIGLSTDCAYGSVTVTVTSRGVFGDSPSGTLVQADGDAIWSTVTSPNWEASGDMWSASVTAPVGLDLRSGGTYDVTASVTDTQSGLSSEAATAFFAVSWEHDAVCPGPGSYVRGYVDDLTAAICAEAPEGAAEGDVCDIYRVTPDGSYLIAADVPFGREVFDSWAPFGSDDQELVYRLCTRTSDGDIDWADFEYELRCPSLRIDFGGSSIELPFNLGRNDSWQKGFEARTHLDGSTAGYWDESVSRTASFTSDLFKFDHDREELLRELATYDGPCFVRTPDGCAFQANVDVTGIGRTYDKGAVSVSITANEVALTDEYRISPEGWEES